MSISSDFLLLDFTDTSCNTQWWNRHRSFRYTFEQPDLHRFTIPISGAPKSGTIFNYVNTIPYELQTRYVYAFETILTSAINYSQLIWAHLFENIFIIFFRNAGVWPHADCESDSVHRQSTQPWMTEFAYIGRRCAKWFHGNYTHDRVNKNCKCNAPDKKKKRKHHFSVSIFGLPCR